MASTIANTRKAIIVIGAFVTLFFICAIVILNSADDDGHVNDASDRIVLARNRRQQIYSWSALGPSSSACPIFVSCNDTSLLVFSCTSDTDCSANGQFCCPTMNGMQFCCHNRAPPPFSVVPPVVTAPTAPTSSTTTVSPPTTSNVTTTSNTAASISSSTATSSGTATTPSGTTASGATPTGAASVPTTSAASSATTAAVSTPAG